MDARGLSAGALLLLAATLSCATRTGQESESPEENEEDVPLDLSIDGVDISHGMLRLSATMVDGAADVGVVLGDACGRRAIGRGFSTLSTLVWALGEDEIAAALGCGLIVRAHVRTEARYVTKVALLAVTPDVAACGSEESEGGPQLQGISASSAGVSILFTSVSPRARLSAGDGVVEATAPATDEENGGSADSATRFDVPGADFARSLLLRRPLVLDGASFETSLSIGGTVLEVEAQDLEVETQEVD